MSATVRFTKIVEQAGKPRLHVLWGGPESDKDFQKAVQTHRVMTIRQENVGSKKDFGLIGFSQEALAQFLIFPRSLKAFEGQRVVGINYELFDPSPEPGAAFKATGASAKKKAKAAPLKVKAEAPEPVSSGRSAQPDPASEGPKAAQAPAADREPTDQSRKDVEPAGKPRSEVSTAREKPTAEFDRVAVLKEVRSAMKELEAGKAVQVFRRLEKLSETLETPASGSPKHRTRR